MICSILMLACILLFPFQARAESGYLGLSIQEISSDMAKALTLEEGMRGLLVRDVSLDGAANQAGIRRGDVLLRLNGVAVTSVRKAVKVLSALQVGDELTIDGVKDGKPRTWKVRLGPWPKARKVQKEAFGTIPGLGLTMAAITPKIRERFTLRWGTVGVLVSLIDEENKVSVDLTRGEVIRRVNNQDVWLPDQVIKAYEQAKYGGHKILLLLVEGAAGYRYVPLPVL